MRTTICTVLFALFLCNINLSAQPFTLDKNIKPIKLELKEHPKYKKAKFNEGAYTLNKGAVNYHYVRGHDIYQFVDIFIFANEGNPNLQADIVYNTWNNIEDSKQTASSENGIINFKVRCYQDIGFTIKSPETKNVDYSIVVNASEPIMNYLGSPFVKASKSDLNPTTATSQQTKLSNPTNSTTMSWWVYIIIGALLLVVGLLAGKLMSRKETLSIIILLILMGVSTESYSQTELNEVQERIALTNTRRGQVDAGIAQINQAFGTADAAEKLIEQYVNLGSCLNSGPPPGRPRIPSFCPGEESSCADCFASARANFNRCRYNLEKLQTIYNCSRSYIDAAVAFGDNVSGYHGVVGLVWQSKRREIMKSVDDLEKAYDKKRVDMLHSFHESLIELDDCEQAHGMADWYDRFGVMFYNFVEMRYHR